MAERINGTELTPQIYQDALLKMSDYLYDQYPDLVVGMGQSVAPELRFLKESGFKVKRLSTKQGHRLYQRGNADNQAKNLAKVLGKSENPFVVDDVMVGGAKMYMLRNTFVYAERPFNAVVLAADPNQIIDGVHVVSTDRDLVDYLRARAEKIRKGRS